MHGLGVGTTCNDSPEPIKPRSSPLCFLVFLLSNLFRSDFLFTVYFLLWYTFKDESVLAQNKGLDFSFFLCFESGRNVINIKKKTVNLMIFFFTKIDEFSR